MNNFPRYIRDSDDFEYCYYCSHELNHLPGDSTTREENKSREIRRARDDGTGDSLLSTNTGAFIVLAIYQFGSSKVAICLASLHNSFP